jgi:hypothetical protein
MLSRRELLTAGVAGRLTSTSGEMSSTAAQSQSELLRDIAKGVEAIDRSIDQAWLSNSTAFGLVGKVRGQMEIYFRSAQRFPDFIDIGLSVFMDLYDWHIKNRQPLVITRGPDNRYWMQFMFTTLILRGEQDVNYVGVPYDKA